MRGVALACVVLAACGARTGLDDGHCTWEPGAWRLVTTTPNDASPETVVASDDGTVWIGTAAFTLLSPGVRITPGVVRVSRLGTPVGAPETIDAPFELADGAYYGMSLAARGTDATAMLLWEEGAGGCRYVPLGPSAGAPVGLASDLRSCGALRPTSRGFSFFAEDTASFVGMQKVVLDADGRESERLPLVSDYRGFASPSWPYVDRGDFGYALPVRSARGTSLALLFFDGSGAREPGGGAEVDAVFRPNVVRIAETATGYLLAWNVPLTMPYMDQRIVTASFDALGVLRSGPDFLDGALPARAAPIPSLVRSNDETLLFWLEGEDIYHHSLVYQRVDDDGAPVGPRHRTPTLNRAFRIFPVATPAGVLLVVGAHEGTEAFGHVYTMPLACRAGLP